MIELRIPHNLECKSCSLENGKPETWSISLWSMILLAERPNVVRRMLDWDAFSGIVSNGSFKQQISFKYTIPESFPMVPIWENECFLSALIMMKKDFQIWLFCLVWTCKIAYYRSWPLQNSLNNAESQEQRGCKPSCLCTTSSKLHFALHSNHFNHGSWTFLHSPINLWRNFVPKSPCLKFLTNQGSFSSGTNHKGVKRRACTAYDNTCKEMESVIDSMKL